MNFFVLNPKKSTFLFECFLKVNIGFECFCVSAFFNSLFRFMPAQIGAGVFLAAKAFVFGAFLLKMLKSCLPQ